MHHPCGQTTCPCCLTRLVDTVLLLPSPLLHRLRTAILAVLLVVLPLQGVVQLVAGLQGLRHMHSAQPAGAASPSLLRALLDHLHAAQPAAQQALGTARWPWSSAELPHSHGSLVHTHGAHDAGVVAVPEADEAGASAAMGATAFLAWLPLPLTVPGAEGVDAPRHAAPLRAGRVVPPALAPPRA